MFAASATRRAQLPDEERLTGADLNILENETRASGRRGGLELRRRVEKQWYCKQRDVQYRADEKMERSKAEKQPPRSRTRPLYKLNRPSLPFIWICVQVQPQRSSRKCRRTWLNAGRKLSSSRVSCVCFFQPAVLELCVGNHLTLPGENPYQKCCCDRCQCSEQESDHIRPPFFACQNDRCD